MARRKQVSSPPQNDAVQGLNEASEDALEHDKGFDEAKAEKDGTQAPPTAYDDSNPAPGLEYLNKKE
jgi:hypothetical protein